MKKILRISLLAVLLLSSTNSAFAEGHILIGGRSAQPAETKKTVPAPDARDGHILIGGRVGAPDGEKSAVDTSAVDTSAEAVSPASLYFWTLANLELLFRI